MKTIKKKVVAGLISGFFVFGWGVSNAQEKTQESQQFEQWREHIQNKVRVFDPNNEKYIHELLLGIEGGGADNKSKEEAVKNLPKEFTAPIAQTMAQIEYIVDQLYIEEIEKEELKEKMLQGAMSALDAHSSYLGAKDWKRMQSDLGGAYFGIGVKIGGDEKKEKIVIKEVHPEGGAFKAGVKENDVVVSADGKDFEFKTMKEFVDTVRGPKGSVELKVLRNGKEKKLSIERSEVQSKTVKGVLSEDKKIGYINVSSFAQETDLELNNLLTSWDQENLEGIVLDLRNNLGGVLGSAVRFGASFMGADQVVIRSEGKREKKEYKTDEPKVSATWQKVPMVILVNRSSASASELLAKALQESKRATVFGEQTFGKGTVQTIIPLDNGTEAVKITVSRFLSPKGDSIQSIGVIPDIWLNAKEENKGGEARLDNHVKNLQEDKEGKVVKPSPEKNAPFVDEWEADRGIRFTEVLPEKLEEPAVKYAIDYLEKNK